jgi:23S rRNA pseudouridine1911/1915/1917 synthase
MPNSTKWRTCFDVIYEDQQLLVVNKPACLATMGVDATVPSLLGEAGKYLAREHVDASCFAAVTGRLDYPVSGLVVIAKDPATADNLRRQQENGTIKKTYHAIVSGAIEPRESELTHWLLKSKRRRSVSAVSEGTADAQIAKLRYTTLRQTESVSMLSINLLTGRKHQIRVQLSEFGHAILGDRKYKSTSAFPEGIALVCKKVSLFHPVNGHNLEWELDYPPAWNTILAEFGADRSK